MTDPNDKVICEHIDHYGIPCSMLSKRELFAAMAYSSIVRDKHHFYLYADGETQESNSPEVYARCAVYMADALIEALNKK